MKVRNGDLLKRHIAFNDRKQATLAEALGISLSRLNAKINNSSGAEFNPAEVAFIRNRYGLSDAETDEIFYSESGVTSH